MSKVNDQSNKRFSQTMFFFGASIILLLVSVVFVIADFTTNPAITFGTCKLSAEVARTDEEKAQGLSGRSEIGKDYAMIFPFKQEQPYFWMKDMLTSIDIVWVSGDKVVDIDTAVPVDDGAVQYQAPVPIDWVIEVAPGRSNECVVTKGTEINGLRY